MQHILIAASALLLAGFGVDEATHGGMAKGMGLGHQHMHGRTGQHCESTHMQHGGMP